MDNNNINSMISIVRQNNGLMQLLDYYKENQEIKLSEVLDKFVEKYKIDLSEHHFFNQYQMISSLLVYIVYPKENYFNKIPTKLKISDLDSAWGIQKYSYDNMSFRDYIRHLRNAVAHGNIEFNEQLEFKFSDKDGTEIVFDSISIENFVRALAWWSMTNDITLKGLKA